MDNKVLVVNRAACSVSYNIPELRVERSFRPLGQTGDRMMISREELKSLSYLHGGKILLDKYLMIEEADLQEELGITVEPEYTYTLEEIRELLTTGTEAQLEDCLNFAPAGVLDLLKREAIAMRLDSHKKRNLISEKMGINLEAMIKNDIIIKSSEQTTTEAPTATTRKAAPVKRKSTPVKK